MNTKRLILITVIVSVVLVGIAALASYLIIQSKEQDASNTGVSEDESTGVYDATGTLLTEEEVQLLDEQIESGESQPITETGIAIEGGSVTSMGLLDLFYHTPTGSFYAIDGVFDYPIVIEEDLRIDDLLHSDAYPGMSDVSWFIDAEGEWQLSFSILAEEQQLGVVHASEEYGQLFIPEFRQSVYTPEGELYLMSGTSVERTIHLATLSEQGIETEELVAIPGTPAQIALYGANSDTVWYERFDEQGRTFRALSIEDGTETILAEDTRIVSVAPNRETFLVTEQTANAFRASVIDATGTKTAVELPGNALAAYAWDASSTSIFTLVGTEGGVVEETEDDVIVDDDTAEELWQVQWKTGAQKRVSVLPTEVPVSTFFFDELRGQLFLYSGYNETLTVFEAGDTRE